MIFFEKLRCLPCPRTQAFPARHLSLAHKQQLPLPHLAGVVTQPVLQTLIPSWGAPAAPGTLAALPRADGNGRAMVIRQRKGCCTRTEALFTGYCH